MNLRFYNTLTKQKEEFKPLAKDQVGMYNCGPTVYDEPHIGNLRAYVFADILRRTLEFNGLSVNQIVNITDVGHLNSDNDDGEDKMTKALRRENKPLTLEAMREVADKYTKVFEENLTTLNIKAPSQMPRASEHIAEDIELIKRLGEKGFTYQTSDGVYFDTAKLPSYGKLGQITESNTSESRINTNPDKKDSRDFALWKFSAQGGSTTNDIGWESPWGKGFPGWHIECSAMAQKYLGETFDIHTGGIDHVSVHHNNEIAQSEAANDKPLARFWLHNAHLQLSGDKMSKSADNFITLSTLKERDLNPLVFRYWLLTAHYRSPIQFSWEALESTTPALVKLANLAQKPVGEIDASYLTKFTDSLNDDLNTPQAIAVAWELAKDDSVNEAAKAATLQKFDEVLGLSLTTLRLNEIIPLTDLPESVQALIKERETTRQNKDFARSDELRDQIATAGFAVKDTDQGPEITQL